MFCLGVRLGMLLLVEDDLRDAGAIAQIDENELTEVAPAVHPAHQHDVFVGIKSAEGAAVFRPFQIAESIKHIEKVFGSFE